MKVLNLKGTPEERGYFHGKQMRHEIHVALTYFKARFNSNRRDLEAHVDTLMQQVAVFRPEYIVEMDAISKAAAVDPFWIYCLNARSELMSSPHECSIIAFPNKGLLGQNWDWAEPIADRLAIHRVETEDGKRFLSLSEPGILAKIGINSSGGVCLNILPTDTKLNGLPVHILLGALLESSDLNNARQLLEQYGKGKASHILVADKESAISVELSATDTSFPNISSIFCHTNHYFEPNKPKHPSSHVNSITRLERLHKLTSQAEILSPETLKTILSNTESPFPILAPYSFHELTGNSGTLATLVMDLNNQRLYIRKGFHPDHLFKQYCFDSHK